LRAARAWNKYSPAALLLDQAKNGIENIRPLLFKQPNQRAYVYAKVEERAALLSGEATADWP
jgi:hypothetical protein